MMQGGGFELEGCTVEGAWVIERLAQGGKKKRTGVRRQRKQVGGRREREKRTA